MQRSTLCILMITKISSQKTMTSKSLIIKLWDCLETRLIREQAQKLIHFWILAKEVIIRKALVLPLLVENAQRSQDNISVFLIRLRSEQIYQMIRLVTIITVMICKIWRIFHVWGYSNNFWQILRHLFLYKPVQQICVLAQSIDVVLSRYSTLRW